MNRIKKNDKVKIISGKYSGAEGIVLQVFPKINKATVEGINKVKKHKKNEDPTKRVVEMELPIQLSNIALIDPNTKGKTTKISYVIDNKVKIRVNRKTKLEIK